MLEVAYSPIPLLLIEHDHGVISSKEMIKYYRNINIHEIESI
jgi:hypothetical protein